MQKIKKIWQNKIFKNYFIIFISFLFLEIIFRLVGDVSFWSYSLIRIFLGLNIIALLLGLIFSFLPKMFARILNLLLVLIASIYGIAELGFRNFIGVYVSLQTKSQLSAVTEVVPEFMQSLKWTYYLMLIPFILLLIYYIFIDKKVSVDLPKKVLNIKVVLAKFIPIFIIAILGIGYYATLRLEFMQNKYQTLTAYDLFKKPTNPSLGVSEFGYIGFGLLDIKEMIRPGEETYEVSYNQSEIEVTETAHTTIDNTIWQSIINKETDSNYNILNQYFIGNNTTSTNEYTGLFENKNVIVIMMESASDIMFNEEYYPNLARLVKNGWTWDNNYSPRNSCNTMNNEFSGMTSLYSISNNCTANVYKTNTYYESIFNLFNNKGYLTNSVHNNYDQFYDRTTIHQNMGSTTFYKLQDLNISGNGYYGDWASDVDMIKSYLNILDNRDTTVPFMSWITTISAHQPYYSTSKFASTYRSLFPSEYSSELKSYMSKLKVTDDAIGVLLEGLEERGILSNTVIVVYGDHYPYAISSDKINPALDYDTSIDLNIDQVPFIIYNPSLEEKHFPEYTSYVNILPTIANLFNLDYDSRLYMGSDLLSEDYNSLVIFADGSWKNEYAYYNASSGNITYYTQKVYNDEEILAINTQISLKLDMSSLAIRTNYFDYLNNKLTSYEEEEKDEVKNYLTLLDN